MPRAKSPERSRRAGDLAALLQHAHERMEFALRTVCDRHQVTATQWRALELLAGSPDQRLRSLQLADQLSTRAPDITRLVERLRRAGWVTRAKPSSDRRVVEVSLSSAGKRLVRAMHPEVRRERHAALSKMTARDREMLAALLHGWLDPSF